MSKILPTKCTRKENMKTFKANSLVNIFRHKQKLPLQKLYPYE